MELLVAQSRQRLLELPTQPEVGAVEKQWLQR